MPSFSYRPPNSPRCYNCWSPAHVGFDCPRPDLPFQERENMRIQYGLPVLNKGNNLVLNPCFNCWNSTDHTFLKCPEERRSTIGREIIRWQRKVPMTITWRQVLVRSGVKPLPLKMKNVAKSTITDMKRNMGHKEEFGGGYKRSGASGDAWRMNNNWRVPKDTEHTPQPSSSLQFPEDEVEEYLRIQNSLFKQPPQSAHWEKKDSPNEWGRGMPRRGFQTSNNYRPQIVHSPSLNMPVTRTPAPAFPKRVVPDSSPLIDISDEEDTKESLECWYPDEEKPKEESGERYPDLEDLSFSTDVWETSIPKMTIQYKASPDSERPCTRTIDSCYETEDVAKFHPGKQRNDDDIISISSDDEGTISPYNVEKPPSRYGNLKRKFGRYIE